MGKFNILIETEKAMRRLEKGSTLHEVVTEARQRYKGLKTLTAVLYYENVLFKIAKFASNKYALRAYEKIKLIELLKNISIN